jgi:hypothetical protein
MPRDPRDDDPNFIKLAEGFYLDQGPLTPEKERLFYGAVSGGDGPMKFTTPGVTRHSPPPASKPAVPLPSATAGPSVASPVGEDLADDRPTSPAV